MRIDHLHLQHFKGFAEQDFRFHPEFNLLVGTNGTGKTTVLDALSIAVGSWFLGVRGMDTRHIRASEVMLRRFDESGEQPGHWEPQFPCEIAASGQVQGKPLQWQRALNFKDGRTTQMRARTVKAMASAAQQAVMNGETIALPLIAYYGTGRLWQEPRERYQVNDPSHLASKEKTSRLMGYENSVDPRLSVANLTRWFARQSWIAYQKQEESGVFLIVKQAITRCIPDAHLIDFDASLGEIIVHTQRGSQPFSNLSDGQRCMLAMVGDLAQKAYTLNPHLGQAVLSQVEGVVLIDELDLHLHPTWQQHVIEDLRTTFPKLQFICTTHSPFLIQSLRSGDELLMLEGQSLHDLGNRSIESIARDIQQVSHTETGLRYAQMKDTAAGYLSELDDIAALAGVVRADALIALQERVKPYADNPAFQAFLETRSHFTAA
jgi:predicted ATP-binding protein involved in virulence